MSTKPAKPAFRSPSEFVRAADAAPASLPQFELTAGTATVTPTPPAPAAPAQKVRAMTGKTKAAKPAPGAPAAEPKPMPWDACNERVIKHFGLRMPEPLHAKLLWIQERTPNATMHSIALEAVAADVERRIAALLERPAT